MPNLTRIAIAAAAVLVVAIGATRLLAPGTDQPGAAVPTATPSASPSAPASPGPQASPAGQILRVDAPFPVRIDITAGPGWQLWGDAGVGGIGWFKGSADPPAGLGLTVWAVAEVYADPCAPGAGPVDPPIGPSVDDLADALAGQPHTTVAVDEPAMVDGYAARHLEYTADQGDCPLPVLRRWATVGGVTRDALDEEHDHVWVIDVDGTIVVVDTFDFPGTSASDLAETESMIQSIDIDPD